MVDGDRFVMKERGAELVRITVEYKQGTVYWLDYVVWRMN